MQVGKLPCIATFCFPELKQGENALMIKVPNEVNQGLKQCTEVAAITLDREAL